MTANNRTATRADAGGRNVLARVENLHLYFDTKRGVVKALEGVSFELQEGEILSLVGETGCGKTITGRSFMQLVPTPPGRYPEGEVTMRSEEECEPCAGAGCGECHDTGYRFDNVLAMSKKQMRQLRDRKSVV